MITTSRLRQLVHNGTWAELSNGEIAVVAVLFAHVDDDGQLNWPSDETIAKLSGLQRRAVQLAKSRLFKRGIVQRPSRVTVYTLNANYPLPPSRTEAASERTGMTPQRTSTASKRTETAAKRNLTASERTKTVSEIPGNAPKQEREQEENVVAVAGDGGGGGFLISLGAAPEAGGAGRQPQGVDGAEYDGVR